MSEKQLEILGLSKAKLMMIHKSTALLMAATIIPRTFLKCVEKSLPPLPGSIIETYAAKISHIGFYGLMIFMPISGISMGYFGGKGLPFYGIYTIPGKNIPNVMIAKNAFYYHKEAGKLFTYLLPIHIGAVGFHTIKGHNILTRMSIFN
jgi:cytochrome b561